MAATAQEVEIARIRLRDGMDDAVKASWRSAKWNLAEIRRLLDDYENTLQDWQNTPQDIGSLDPPGRR